MHCTSKRRDHSYACRYNLHSMQSTTCQPCTHNGYIVESSGLRRVWIWHKDRLLTDRVGAWKAYVCNKPFSRLKFLFQHKTWVTGTTYPYFIKPRFNCLHGSLYPVFYLPVLHLLEANEGRSEETDKEVEGDRYKEGDEIANFHWVAERTVVVVEDGPEAEAVFWCYNRWHPRRRLLSHRFMSRRWFRGWYLGGKAC